jgi:hypothetical protein
MKELQVSWIKIAFFMVVTDAYRLAWQVWSNTTLKKMLKEEMDDFVGVRVGYSSSSKLDRIASNDNVNRAFWEVLDFPTKTVILADHVTRKEYFALEERYVRELASLKLEFDSSLDDPYWGKIIVRAVKTRVHCVATLLLSKIVRTLSRLQNNFEVDSGGECKVRYRSNPNKSRESDACIALLNTDDLRFIAVLESAYSESAKITEQEFEQGLRWYFENDDDINLVIGVYVTYIPPSMESPDHLPMVLVVLHRNDSIDPQRIHFGQDADHSQPIEFTVDCPTLFGMNEIPTEFPQVFTIDIRYLMPFILSEIHALREMRKNDSEESLEDDGPKASKKKKKSSKKRKGGQLDDHFRYSKDQDRKPGPGGGGGGRILRSSSRILRQRG